MNYLTLCSFVLLLFMIFLILYYLTWNFNQSFLYFSILFFTIVTMYVIRYKNYMYKKCIKTPVLSTILKVDKVVPIQQTISFKEFLECTTMDYGKKIPPFIFRTSSFKLNELPSEMKTVLEKSISLNKNYTQIYLDNDDCDSFVYRYYPHYFNEYKIVIPGAFKADLVRLMLLDQFGGVYNDIGHEYLAPLDNLISEKEELILVRDKSIFYGMDLSTLFRIGLYNAFMCCYKGHPIIKKMLEHCIHNVKNRYYGITHLDITGPRAIHKVFCEFTNTKISDKRVGVYYYNNYRIRMCFINGMNIVDENIKLIHTKFKNYYQIMYTNKNTPTYIELWVSGLVYAMK